jgi:hypothetical protein
MMNYEMLDLLDKAIEKCGVDDIELLKTEGIIVDNQINVNKVNLMVGAYASDLVDCMMNAEMNPFEAISHLENLFEENQFMGMYYFILSLINALGLETPYLYMQLPADKSLLKIYMRELTKDLTDCATDE